MKFSVERTQMADAVRKAIKVVPKITTDPFLEGLLVEVNADRGIISITGTDLNIQIQCRIKNAHIEEDGEFVMPVVVLNMLNLMTGDTVLFESSPLYKNSVQISSGNTVYDIPVMTAEDYPKIKIPYPKEYVCIGGISEVIKNTAFAAETGNESSPMQYIKLNFTPMGVTAEAMNNQYGAFAKSKRSADSNLSLIIHQKALGILSGLISQKDTVYVGVNGKSVVFIKEDLVFHTRIHNGEYRESSQLMDRIVPQYKAMANAAELLNLAENTSSILSPGDDQGINMSFTADKIVLQTVTATGKSKGAIEATDVIVTPDSGFFYQVKALIDCIRHTSGNVNLILDKQGFLMLSAGENKYFLAPRRPIQIAIKAKGEKKTKTVKSKSTKKAA